MLAAVPAERSAALSRREKSEVPARRPNQRRHPFLIAACVGCGALTIPGPADADDADRSEAPAPPADLYVPAPLSLGPGDIPAHLVEIPVPPAVREGLQLREDAWRALRAMIDAAAEEDIGLRVVSAYRSFDYQEGLHQRAVRRHGDDQEWVAAPGTSEHQLGTTVDFADAALAHVLEPSFARTREGRWLETNAARFGFVCSYTEDNRPWTGYRAEPWHYRYLPGPEKP